MVEVIKGEQIKVKSPYNADFVAKARAAGGKWRAPYWVFPSSAEEAVESALRSVYKWQPGGELRTVRVTLKERMTELTGPVMLGGKVIANARGRDSGARPGDDVVYEKKSPDSGGSVKNWLSIAPEGAVIKLTNVTTIGLAEIEALAETGKLTFEVVNDKAAKAAKLASLKAQLKALQEEIAALEKEVD